MNAIRHTRRLRQKIEQALPELAAATTALIMHPRFRELYVEFAVTVHQMIRASVPLMRTAHRRCLELKDADPVAAAMVPYLAHHILEEMHHDDWLLEDMELLKVPRETVLGRMPPSPVASMIGAHYYWIHHHHPVAHLGQIAAMEGYPAGVAVVDLMVERTGYPREAFRTIEKHCHLDPLHRDEFDRALDEMPLTDEHHEILAVSALHTVRMAARAYRAIVQGANMPMLRSDVTVEAVGKNGTYRLRDTARGTTHQFGEQEKYLLTRCDGRQTPEEACRAFGGHFEEPLTRPELDEFLAMARAEHWFAGED